MAPSTKQAAHREARPPLPRLSGPFFLALERASWEAGAWPWGCGDSRAEAGVATGTVTRHQWGRRCGERLVW